MPLVPFDTLPDNARVWVFASDRSLDDNAACRLLGEVDRFLAHWQAHGNPLDGARDWRHDRFLTIAVDQTTAGASGCSIDGLYRGLRALQGALDTNLLAGGVLYYRDDAGDVTAVSRAEFAARAARGDISRDTVVFDLAVESLGEWRDRFEAPASAGWHVRLLPAEAAGWR